MKKELVSVIMTSYNSDEKFLKQSIQSVLCQKYENYEFIIVDDGSTNNILQKVLRSVDINNKIKVIYQENKGLCSARNTGICNSRGKFISFIDDDDIWYENKLSDTVIYFNKVQKDDCKLGMVFTQSEIIDEDNNKYGVYGFDAKGDIFHKLLGKNIVGPPSSVLIEKEKLESVGLFNEEFIYAEDIELWYRFAKKYNIYSLDKPLIQYRYRKNSLSKNYKKMGEYTEKALYLILKNCNLSKSNKSEILTKYYTDFACLFFSNNDIKEFRKYFYKYIKYNNRKVPNIRLSCGFILSLFGIKFIRLFNKIRKNKEIVPVGYLNICDYNRKGD